MGSASSRRAGRRAARRRRCSRSAANGARYVGDEWVYVAADGSRVSGIPEPVRVWDWHLHDLPPSGVGLGTGTARAARGLRALHAMGKRLTRRTARRRRAHVPARIAGDRAPTSRGRPSVGALWQGVGEDAADAPFDRLVFVESHDGGVDPGAADRAGRDRPPDGVLPRLRAARLHGLLPQVQVRVPGRASPLVEERGARSRSGTARDAFSRGSPRSRSPIPIRCRCPPSTRRWARVSLSESELDLARRVDWRFLLPTAELGRVACVGPLDGRPAACACAVCRRSSAPGTGSTSGQSTSPSSEVDPAATRPGGRSPPSGRLGVRRVDRSPRSTVRRGRTGDVRGSKPCA